MLAMRAFQERVTPRRMPRPPSRRLRRPASPDTSVGADREVRFGGLCLTAPDTWNREKSPVKFILAEFSLRRSEGDSADAQLTVTLAVNNDPDGLKRLREQIRDTEQGPENKIERLTIGGREIVLVDSVESSDEEGDSSASSASEGRDRSLNAMVFLGNSVYFVNCTGPEKTVTERVGEFRAFLETMKAAE